MVYKRGVRTKSAHRLSVKPRFFVFVTLLIALIAGLTLFLTLRAREYTVRTQTLSQSVHADAVVIRDESVVAAAQTGQIYDIVGEGESVKKGDEVVRVYGAQFSASAVDELAALRDEILAYQRSDILGDVRDADLAALDEQIEQTTTLAADAVYASDASRVRELEAQLQALMRRRSEYLRRNYRVDEALSSMLEREEALQKKIDDWTTTVDAPFAGRVSFSLDGCEHILNAGVLSQLTSRQLSSAVAQASWQRVTQATQYTSLFRIVHTDAWYCVLPKDDSLEIVPEQTYTLRSDSIPNLCVQATALSNEAFAQNDLIVFRVQGDPVDVLNARQIKVSIEKSFEGLCVPRRALYGRKGQTGVYLISGDVRTFTPVTVLAREGDEVVVLCDALHIGDRVRLK